MSNLQHAYIRRRSRICDWCWRTRGCRAAGRNSPDIWSCRRVASRWSRATACRGRHSRRGTSSWPRAESRRTRTSATGPCTGRVCRRISWAAPRARAVWAGWGRSRATWGTACAPRSRSCWQSCRAASPWPPASAVWGHLGSGRLCLTFVYMRICAVVVVVVVVWVVVAAVESRIGWNRGERRGDVSHKQD